MIGKASSVEAALLLTNPPPPFQFLVASSHSRTSIPLSLPLRKAYIRVIESIQWLSRLFLRGSAGGVPATCLAVAPSPAQPAYV